MAREPPVKKKQSALRGRQNEKPVYRGQAGGCHFGIKKVNRTPKIQQS